MIGCSVYTISLALSLLVLLAGLFLLAYAKKEGLGKLTKISSYVAILFGGVVFVGGLTCALFFGNCHNGKGCKGGKCPIPPHERMEMRHHKGMMMKGGCHKMEDKDCCSKDRSHVKQLNATRKRKLIVALKIKKRIKLLVAEKQNAHLEKNVRKMENVLMEALVQQNRFKDVRTLRF